MRRVEIEWLDAHGDGGGWMEVNDIKPGMHACRTVGFVAKEDEEFICLIQTHGFDEQYYNHLCIPKGMITEMKELRGDDERRGTVH
jgi:hypothetical protein